MPLILLVIGLGLIIYNYRAINKEEKIKQENDKVDISFERVFKENKEELDDYKIEIGMLRRDIAESITELQEEILEIRNNVNELKKNKKVFENKNEDNLAEGSGEASNLQRNFNIDDGLAPEINFSEQVDGNKTQNIKKLLEDGLTEEEICHELSVSKGEVILVKDLFKK